MHLDYYLKRLMFANVTLISIVYRDSKVAKFDLSNMFLLSFFKKKKKQENIL